MQSNDYSHNVNPFTTDMLDLLFDRMPMGIVILDADYVVLRYNALRMVTDGIITYWTVVTTPFIYNNHRRVLSS